MGSGLPWYLVISTHNPKCPRKAQMRTRTCKFNPTLFPLEIRKANNRIKRKGYGSNWKIRFSGVTGGFARSVGSGTDFFVSTLNNSFKLCQFQLGKFLLKIISQIMLLFSKTKLM